ncbi:MAG: sugar ABC transporter permease [Treponema sp.]|jgi:raffinose/stachyose/melibiose transport system permease protein|nr:sugar ABC transporter permease [Treponema sp.]
MEKTLRKYFLFFVGPTLIAFILAFVTPFLLGVFLSFSRFTTVLDAQWVGAANYRRVFSNPDFLNALGFSVRFTAVSVVLINALAFSLAMLLTREMPGTNVFRTIIFMPNLIGGIVLGYIWQFIINGYLSNFGVTITVDPKYGFWGLVILNNWQYVGYMMIIYIAGIQNIPEELNEAAKIDGASPFTKLTRITLPLIMPSITITMFLSITNSFRMFDQNLSLTAGMPSKQTAMVSLDIYNTFYSRNGWEGVGQAKAVIFFIIVVLISIIQLSITRKRELES